MHKGVSKGFVKKRGFFRQYRNRDVGSIRRIMVILVETPCFEFLGCGVRSFIVPSSCRKYLHASKDSCPICPVPCNFLPGRVIATGSRFSDLLAVRFLSWSLGVIRMDGVGSRTRPGKDRFANAQKVLKKRCHDST